MFIRILSFVQLWLGVFWLLSCIPGAAASGLNERPFPDITFRDFSDFIRLNFNSDISLSSVLVILLSLTENVQLLGLHGRQQKKHYVGERSTPVTAWIRVLARSLRQKLESDDTPILSDVTNGIEDEQVTLAIAQKLDVMAKLLNLQPYNGAGKFITKPKPVLHNAIEPIHVICPNTLVCKTKDCHPYSLVMTTKPRDIPYVTLVKNFRIYKDVPVLAGYCNRCKTIYYADHERSPSASILGEAERVYLNSAKYIKIGQSIWVDRAFSSAVLSGVYNFHASAAAYTEFWNSSFLVSKDSVVGKLSRRHIWQAFVQESVRMVGALSDTNLNLTDNLPIDEVTKEAFHVLGERGLVLAADGHTCKECTQRFRQSEDDPRIESEDEDEDDMRAYVHMVVVDGIVIGHSICAYPDCTSELSNARGGVYCALHEDAYGAQCHVSNCTNAKVEGTLACQAHQEKWQRFQKYHRTRQLSGYRRAQRRSDDSWPWMAEIPRANSDQPHDQDAVNNEGSRDCFIPSRTYCVETICAPCGVVVAWAKFAKSESPTNILNFLEQVYPTEECRPNYICVDKACLVLRTSVSNGSWMETWSKTSRFIVDSYHYTNHSAEDNLCRRYCNPTPRDGSDPNLVVKERDQYGHTYYRNAFNTQACEQLNAWLGGFESILRRMAPGNFNWFLHTMLTYHTTHVRQRIARHKEGTSNSSSDDSSG
jgi:CxC5 like cysteine cluster associated with KDZ transposases/CxC6 like cysteine cluster associated with KDZ transposases